MASPLSPDKLLAALKKWDVPYKEYSGWRTRGRPGSFSDIEFFMVHHTGGGSDSSSYLEFLFETGRPSEGIPGPLCQFAIGVDGTVHVGAAGRANQGGRGSSSTLSTVRGENYYGYSSEITPGGDNTDGNAVSYGVEIIYAGTSAMTSAQYRSAVRLAAAIVDAFGWSALRVIGHREWSGRKWDPGQCPMDKFRRDVRDLLKSGQDWFDMANKADLKEAIVEVLRDPKHGIVTRSGQKWSLRYTIDWLAWKNTEMHKDVNAIPKRVWYEENPYSGKTYGYILRRIGQFFKLIFKRKTATTTKVQNEGTAA